MKTHKAKSIKNNCKPTNINIQIAMNSDKFNTNRSPSIDYNQTDLEDESISERVHEIEQKMQVKKYSFHRCFNRCFFSGC